MGSVSIKMQILPISASKILMSSCIFQWFMWLYAPPADGSTVRDVKSDWGKKNEPTMLKMIALLGVEVPWNSLHESLIWYLTVVGLKVKNLRPAHLLVAKAMVFVDTRGLPRKSEVWATFGWRENLYLYCTHKEKYLLKTCNQSFSL